MFDIFKSEDFWRCAICHRPALYHYNLDLPTKDQCLEVTIEIVRKISETTECPFCFEFGLQVNNQQNLECTNNECRQQFSPHEKGRGRYKKWNVRIPGEEALMCSALSRRGSRHYVLDDLEVELQIVLQRIHIPELEER